MRVYQVDLLNNDFTSDGEPMGSINVKILALKVMIIVFFAILRPTANEITALRSRDPRQSQLLL